MSCKLPFFMPISEALIGSSRHSHNAAIEIMKLSVPRLNTAYFSAESFGMCNLMILVRSQVSLASQRGLEVSCPQDRAKLVVL